MIIKDIMIKNVLTISPDTFLKDALTTMEENRIRHLPVINEEEEIVGIISDRDLRDASPSIFETTHNELMNKPIKELMITDVITALPHDFVEEAANMMMENQISCLPIEEDGKIAGIITEKDLLNTLVKLTGADTPSSRLEIEVPNQSGMLSNVASIIKQHNINIQSVLVYPAADPSEKILVFRLQSMDLRVLVKSLRHEYRILWPVLEMKA